MDVWVVGNSSRVRPECSILHPSYQPNRPGTEFVDDPQLSDGSSLTIVETIALAEAQSGPWNAKAPFTSWVSVKRAGRPTNATALLKDLAALT